MNLINIGAGDLETFLSVADHGSFRRAAEVLGRSQPAISARIQHLEAVLGVRLFERTTRRVTITQAGERLRLRAEPMVAELRDLAASFREEASLKRGSLRLGCSPSVAASFLPAVIAHFRQRYPAIDLILFDDFFGRALDRLVQGEVDLAVIPFEPQQEGLAFELLTTDEHVVALPDDHDLAREADLSLAHVAELPLICMPPQSAAWTSLRRAFEAAGLPFRPAYQTRNALTSLAMVRAGLGIALVTRMISSVVSPAGVTLVPLKGRPLTRRIGIVTAVGRELSHAADAMRLMLRADAATMSAPHDG